MKRCPQCDFLYEDEQDLCDMDGEQLVLDARAVSQQSLVTIEPARLPIKSQSRRRAILLFAGIIIAAVMFALYYASSRVLNSNPEIPSAALENPEMKSESATPQSTPRTVSASPVVAPAPARASAGQSSSNARTIPSPTLNLSTPARPTAGKKNEQKPKADSLSQKPLATEPKKESRIGSILKKTGRILKKPFKLSITGQGK